LSFLDFISLEQEKFFKAKVICSSDIKSVGVFRVLHVHAVDYLPPSTSPFPLLLSPIKCSVFLEDFQAGMCTIPPEMTTPHYMSGKP